LNWIDKASMLWGALAPGADVFLGGNYAMVTDKEVMCDAARASK